ncbi:GNAT family N-acetyltransferase [Nocardioides bruguierae]|uniref:GNAT family N-acetyltransferase n=1 Tax=Nocardioides bruguierae TaxID=2945102 RepID=UPI00201FD3C2|nr:GNAT family N-acetyltransferase [Nocardioides bruguierae]MCL8025130.1 GNAT family N-acetyltransferase [Nocardioides bruguierae]
MTVRAAGPGDTDAVAALEARNLGPDAWSRGLVEAGLTGDVPTVSYLVALGPDGQVVGHAVVSLVDVAELQRISVLPEHRRTGLASALLDAVVALAREGGCDRVLLEVREDNDGARAFYARHGFVDLARRKRYYADGATAVVCELTLGPTPVVEV